MSQGFLMCFQCSENRL